MKTMLLLLICLPGAGLQAQYSRIIIQLTDKGGTPYSLSTPSQYLSQRAIDRRTRYSIGLDSTDLPISPAYVAAVKAQGAVNVLSQSKWLNQLLIQTTDSATIRKIRTLPFVKSSAPVASVKSPDVPSPFRKWEPVSDREIPHDLSARVNNTTADVFNYGDAYKQIHIHQGDYLHNKGFSGKGMIITMLDAGFYNYTTNTAFDSIRMRGQVLGVRDFVAFDNSVAEDDTHGKNCLSIIAANWPGRMVGSAPWASFWLIRTEDVGSEYPVEEHNWVVGAEFADSCGTDLITSSLGYTTFDDAAFNHNYNQFYTNSAMVTMGATLAAKKGIIVTNSAGNDGSNTWRYLSFPADADSVCTVAAIDTAGTIASFSSYGYPGKQKPNVASVGSGTVIAGNSAPTLGNGTSYSNPNMAGLITCLWQAFPRFNNMKILNAVYASSNRFSAPDNRYGYGVPDMKAAYRSLKTEENQLLYGSNWLMADPATFTDSLTARFVSQFDGTASITLLNASQAIVATQTVAVENQEVYTAGFGSLSALPGGNYTLRYSDGVQSKTIQVQKAAVLPASALQATAHWINKEVTLDWSTLAESNTGYFSVSRSANGTDFTLLANIPAAGNSQLAKQYSFRDAEAGSLQAGILYYQIVLFDKDNKKTTAATIKVLNKTVSSGLLLFPNPARGSVQLVVASDLEQPVTIRVISHLGQLVKEQKARLVSGTNTLTFSLAGMAKGEYLLSIQTTGQTLSEKLMVR